MIEIRRDLYLTRGSAIDQRAAAGLSAMMATLFDMLGALTP